MPDPKEIASSNSNELTDIFTARMKDSYKAVPAITHYYAFSGLRASPPYESTL